MATKATMNRTTLAKSTMAKAMVAKASKVKTTKARLMRLAAVTPLGDISTAVASYECSAQKSRVVALALAGCHALP